MKYQVKRIAVLGMLIALEIVLSRILTINIPPLIKINVAFMPIALAGYLYGPLWAGAAAAVADIFGTLYLNGIMGDYVPWFTITAFLIGMTFGLFLHNNKLTFKNALGSALVVSLLLKIALNCFWFYIMFGLATVLAYLPGLLINNTMMIAAQTTFLLLLNVWGKPFINPIIDDHLAVLRLKARRYFSGQPELRRIISDSVIRQCLALPQYQSAKTVFCYVGTEKEVDTQPILEQALADGKTVCVPLCGEENTMTARVIRSLDDLSCVGPYGIAEPSPDAEIVLPQDIDIVFVPCSATDKRHFRIGKGGWYYDRYLKDTGMAKIGICPAALVVNRLPVRDHDVPVDAVVTDKTCF